MLIREQISKAFKESMIARDEIRISTIRLIQAAIKDRDIAARSKDHTNGCEDLEILELLAKMVKQREESILAYENGGRLELAEREKAELEIIRDFMPEQMSEAEIEEIARKIISEMDATGLKDMGKLMSEIKERYPGKMDFSKAGCIVKDILLKMS